MSYGTIRTDTKRWLTEMNDVPAEYLETGDKRIDIVFDGALDESFNVGTYYGYKVFRLINQMLETWYPYSDWALELYDERPEPPERLASVNNEERAR